MGIKLGDNINITAGLPIDCRYQNAAVGPYSSVAQVNSTITSDIRHTGLTVNILGTEYWYKDGILDINLVEKTTGGGLLNWTGSTANAIGTYISVNGICAQPNLTFNGSVLSVTGNVVAATICATTCFVGSGAGLTGTASSLTAIPASHTHGSINNGGCVGTTTNLILKTTTNGCVTTLAAGSAGQFLAYDGNWATPTGGVSKTGTPAICQVAVWTDSSTICGGGTLTMSSNQLCVAGATTVRDYTEVLNTSGAEGFKMQWNNTEKSIDFIIN